MVSQRRSLLSTFVVCVLVVALLSLTSFGKARGVSKAQFSRLMRNKKQQCAEKEECLKLPDDQFEACLLYCLSSQCYEKVYAEEPLEEGEVDADRWDQFQKCIRQSRIRL
mmetsp:Transcript_4464/g.8165  ORF Transcript_4464/g.8165 Transcript_4464/m.8165 type:complete len:110 (+) Transcript_4464:208-537(+)